MPTDVGVSASFALSLQQLMSRYQQADATAVPILIKELSPQLYRFFASQMGSKTDADDMLQDLWLRIHQARHAYRPGEPVLPWVYAIARCVRTDSYRRRRRIASRETTVDVLPELSKHQSASSPLPFEDLVAPLSERQRTVLTMLKVNGMSLEEVARATASTIGAVKQDAHRAYARLRRLFERVPSEQPLRRGWRRLDCRTEPKTHNCPRVRREFISEKGINETSALPEERVVKEVQPWDK
jgi:RNA polymerase sigma-70 factor, ECF subfamily